MPPRESMIMALGGKQPPGLVPHEEGIYPDGTAAPDAAMAQNNNNFPQTAVYTSTRGVSCFRELDQAGEHPCDTDVQDRNWER